MFNRGQAHTKWKNNFWLDIDYGLLAEAALYINDYHMTILYAEIKLDKDRLVFPITQLRPHNTIVSTCNDKLQGCFTANNKTYYFGASLYSCALLTESPCLRNGHW